MNSETTESAANYERIFKEYQISKDSIKSVMGQLIGVTASLLTVTIVLVKILFDETPSSTGQDPVLSLMVIFLMNFIVAFTVYQNVQIVALQKHIKSLEEKLSLADVFRWESTIARVWYGSTPVAIIFNALVVIPPLCIFVSLYYELARSIGVDWKIGSLIAGNLLYFIILWRCYVRIEKLLENVFHSIQSNT